MSGLRESVEKLLNVGAWCQVLTVCEPVYRELTLEFLSTFKRLRGNDVWDKSHAIYFQVGGQDHHLKYTEFVLLLGIYNRDHTLTEKQCNLISSYPPRETQVAHWRTLSNYDRPFRLDVTTTASLKSPVLKFVHALLSGTITSRDRCTGNINLPEFSYLLSIQYLVPLHHGFIVATLF